MTRVVITGAKGRMGQALIQCATRFENLQVTGKIDVRERADAAQVA
jgi:dihydrodipicolinate reductase